MQAKIEKEVRQRGCFILGAPLRVTLSVPSPRCDRHCERSEAISQNHAVGFPLQSFAQTANLFGFLLFPSPFKGRGGRSEVNVIKLRKICQCRVAVKVLLLEEKDLG